MLLPFGCTHPTLANRGSSRDVLISGRICPWGVREASGRRRMTPTHGRGRVAAAPAHSPRVHVSLHARAEIIPWWRLATNPTLASTRGGRSGHLIPSGETCRAGRCLPHRPVVIPALGSAVGLHTTRSPGCTKGTFRRPSVQRFRHTTVCARTPPPRDLDSLPVLVPCTSAQQTYAELLRRSRSRRTVRHRSRSREGETGREPVRWNPRFPRGPVLCGERTNG